MRVLDPDRSLDIGVLVHDIGIVLREYENRREIHGRLESDGIRNLLTVGQFHLIYDR